MNQRIKITFLWWLDKRDGVWKHGDKDCAGSDADGMGVFKEPDDKWYGNIVLAGRRDITGVGPYDTSIEAMSEAEIMYLRLKTQPI